MSRLVCVDLICSFNLRQLSPSKLGVTQETLEYYSCVNCCMCRGDYSTF